MENTTVFCKICRAPRPLSRVYDFLGLRCGECVTCHNTIVVSA